MQILYIYSSHAEFMKPIIERNILILSIIDRTEIISSTDVLVRKMLENNRKNDCIRTSTLKGSALLGHTKSRWAFLCSVFSQSHADVADM